MCVRDQYGNAEFNQRVTDDHALTMRNYGLTKDNRGVGQCVIFDYNKDYTLDLSLSDDYCGTYQIVGKYFDFYYKSKDSSTWTKISDVAVAQLNILRYYPHGVQAMWTSQLIMSAVFYKNNDTIPDIENIRNIEKIRIVNGPYGTDTQAIISFTGVRSMDILPVEMQTPG